MWNKIKEKIKNILFEIKLNFVPFSKFVFLRVWSYTKKFAFWYDNFFLSPEARPDDDDLLRGSFGLLFLSLFLYFVSKLVSPIFVWAFDVHIETFFMWTTILICMVLGYAFMSRIDHDYKAGKPFFRKKKEDTKDE